MSESETKARTMLVASPMTRYALQRKLHLSPQQTRRVIKAIGAIVVGYEQSISGKGYLSPLYGLKPEPVFEAPAPIGRVSSVWELGDPAPPGATS